jgi:hypothetical protein
MRDGSFQVNGRGIGQDDRDETVGMAVGLNLNTEEGLKAIQ